MLEGVHNYKYSAEIREEWIQATQFSTDVYSTESTENPNFEFVVMDDTIISKPSLPSRYQSALGGIDTHIKQMIDMATSENLWFEEGTPEPNEVAKRLAFRTAKDIFSVYKLIPSTIRASVEGGIMITYWNNQNKCSLKIEVYNDGEKAGLVNQDKKILRCSDIASTSDLAHLVDTFER